MKRSPDDALAAVQGFANDNRRALYLFVVGSAGPVGRDQAARTLGLARSVAAYHLDRLVDAGLLEAHFERPPGRSGPGAGRPTKLYRRGTGEIGISIPARDYEMAARLLADAVSSEEGRAVREGLIRRAREVGREIGEEAVMGGSHGGRPMASVREVLTDRGYEPFWDGAALRLRNCPFRALVDDGRDVVCEMNAALLEGVTRVVTRGRARAVLDRRPGVCCVALLPDARDAGSATEP